MTTRDRASRALDWGDPGARDALVSALVNDANAVVAAFADAELDEAAALAVALLALVAGQDVEPAQGVRWPGRPVADRAPGGRGPGHQVNEPRPGTPASPRRPPGRATGPTCRSSRTPG